MLFDNLDYQTAQYYLKQNFTLLCKSLYVYMSLLREAAKNVLFFSGPATKALPLNKHNKLPRPEDGGDVKVSQRLVELEAALHAELGQLHRQLVHLVEPGAQLTHHPLDRGICLKSLFYWSLIG